ncbi:MAG: NADH-quinone oxidoreductase subunit NuoE, partial [Planctomycetes bacterium]|nr:NADH-quinone oxidoreductase subunit NuoE [Planctomycetota bacterium]
ELAAEQDRQTVASLERKARNTRRGWLLAVTAVVMVACLKWFTSLRGQAAPQLAKLIALRASMLTATAMAPATSEQRADRAEEPDPDFVDALVAREGCSPEAAIPILRAIQDHHGYLPDEALRRVCELTEITPAQIAGTSSFYANFRRSPVGRHVVRVCHGTACHVAGARQVTNELRRHLKIPSDGDTDPEGMFTVDQVACLGCCSLAPVMMIDEHVVGKLTPTSACTALAALREEVEA